MRWSLIRPHARSSRASAIVTAALLSSACIDNPTAVTPTASGRVTVSATGEPVAGASVAVGDITATTDAEGRYQMSGLSKGAARIRVTARGFEAFDGELAVMSDMTARDVALKRVEVFEVGEITVQISEKVSKVRGVLVALGGPDTRGFATGRAFGAPSGQLEASLQILGQQMRRLAAARGLAIVGSSRAAMPNSPESDETINSAIQQAAILSGRADLAGAPFLVYGISGGGSEASGFALRNASRVAGLFLKVPSSVETITSGPALEVPTYVVLAQMDAVSDNGILTAAFAANRAAGAPWALAVELGVAHHTLSAAQRDLTIDWMNTILGMRLGAAPSDPLRPIAESSGWVGDPATSEAMPWSSHTGNPRAASWLPSQGAAERWRAFVRTGMPVPAPEAPKPFVCANSSHCLAFTRQGGVFATASDESSAVVLLENAMRPAWSHDGKMIAFTRPNRRTIEGWQICIAEHDGTNVRCAVSDEGGLVVGGPAWSPDGEKVAFSVFVYSCPGGQCGQTGGYFSRVMLLDTRTMYITRVGQHEVHSLAWSPDGRRIAYAAWGVGHAGRGALHVMNADGSNSQFIGQGLGSYSVDGISWSPDGARLGLSLSDENACPWYCDTALGVVNADGGGLQVLATAKTAFQDPQAIERYIDFPAWSPDGSRLLYTHWRNCYDIDPECPSEVRAWNFAAGVSQLLVSNATQGALRP